MCGRWYAFIMVDFLLAGAGSVVMLPISLVLMLMGKLDAIAEQMGGMGMVFAVFALCALICLPIGLLMYRHALKKCPDNLKKAF